MQDADRQHVDRGDGSRKFPHVRYRLLSKPAKEERPLPIRRRAPHEFCHQVLCGGASRRASRDFLQRIRGLYGENGEDSGEDGDRGGDTKELRGYK